MIENFLSIITKEKKLVFSCILAAFALFLVYSVFMYRPQYKTNAKVFIRNLPQYSVANGTESGDSMVASQSGYSNPLFNIIEILQSESLSNKVYDAIKDKYPKELASLNIKSASDFNRYFKNRLNTKIIPSTDTLALTLRWADKKSADYILSQTIDQFREENLNLRRSVESKQAQYIDSYLKDIEKNLASVRKQIRDYRISENIVNTDEESNNIILAKYNMEKQIADLKSQINYNDRKLANYSKQLGFKNATAALRATALGQDPYLVTLQNELASAQQKYANLTGKYNDAYPDVIAAKNEVSAISANISEKSKEVLENVSVKRGIYDKPSQDIVTEMAKTQAETQSLRAQLSSLMGSISMLKGEELQLPNKIFNLEELKKQEDTLKTIYESVKRKQLDARFKENQIVDNIFVLDYPSLPKKDNTGLMLSFLGFIYTGALAGVIGGWLKDSPKSFALRSFKPIGTLPFINLEFFKSEYGDNGLIRSTESMHGASYINIASNLIKQTAENEDKLISFVSSSIYRNSSFITLNIAASIAKFGKSVVLISSDYKCSNKIREQFNIKPENNSDLINILQSINYEISISKYISNNYMNILLEKNSLKIRIDSVNDRHFHILPITNEIENLYDYVLSVGFEEFITFLRNKFDYVLIDIPAQPMIYPVCSSLMQKSDMNILIADSSISSENLAETINELKDFDIEVPYVILRNSGDKNEKSDDEGQIYANELS